MSDRVALRGPRPAIGGRTWASPLQAVLGPTLGGTCRVCREHVGRGEQAWSCAWFLGVAHERCGWLAPGEDDPHEERSEGRSVWRWRCPDCGLDAAGTEKPHPLDPLACRRCMPRGYVVGAVVRAVTTMASGPNPSGRAQVMRGDRGMVLGVSDDGRTARVEFVATHHRPAYTGNVSVDLVVPT